MPAQPEPCESDFKKPRRGPPGAEHLAGISPEQWAEFRANGFVKLGRVIPDELFQRMLQRTDEIMLGTKRYPSLIMQLDPGGTYGGSVQADQTAGFKGATRAYRKIGEAGAGLEVDDVFREAMSLPVFREACAEVYGAHVDVAVYRAMIFNKPAEAGTDLPWHQDGGEWWGLDRDPLLFVWTALDDSKKSNGCVRVVPGSHRRGLLSRRGHTLSAESLRELQVEECAQDVEVARGESVLMHNFLVHSSRLNPTGEPRRAFSVNYADARTRVLDPRPSVQPEGRPGPDLGLKPGGGLPLLFRNESLPSF